METGGFPKLFAYHLERQILIMKRVINISGLCNAWVVYELTLLLEKDINAHYHGLIVVTQIAALNRQVR